MAVELTGDQLRIRLSFESDLLVTEFLTLKGESIATLKTRGQESASVIAALKGFKAPT